jgi:hypothetical protein
MPYHDCVVGGRTILIEVGFGIWDADGLEPGHLASRRINPDQAGFPRESKKGRLLGNFFRGDLAG